MIYTFGFIYLNLQSSCIIHVLHCHLKPRGFNPPSFNIVPEHLSLGLPLLVLNIYCQKISRNSYK